MNSAIFEAEKQLTNADWVPQTMTLKAHFEKTGHCVLEQYAYMKRDLAVNYVTADAPIASFDGDRHYSLAQMKWEAGLILFLFKTKELSTIVNAIVAITLLHFMIHAGKLAAKRASVLVLNSVRKILLKSPPKRLKNIVT